MTVQQMEPRQTDVGSLQYFEPRAEEPPGNQLRLREGWIKVQDTLLHQPEQFTVGFGVVSGLNKVRWDLVYLDTAGVVQVTPGGEVADTSPEFSGATKPPAYSYPIAYVQVNEAGSVQVDDNDITDVRPKLNVLEVSTYLTNYVAVNGEFYGTTLGKLDRGLQRADAYTGKPTNGAVLPQYSGIGSNEHAIVDDDPLATGVAKLDLSHENSDNFSGRDNPGQSSPDYSGQTPHYNIAPGDPLETAIGKLDASQFLSAVPTGLVASFAMPTPPAGWAECDGSIVSMTTYEKLYDAIGNLFGLAFSTTVTANPATDFLNSGVAHGLADDDVVEFTSSVTLPTGLSADQKYFVVNSTPTSFQVSLTKSGLPEDFTDTGTGTHQVHAGILLPEIRAEFVRGWDNGRGVDVGRVLGSFQTDVFKRHQHLYNLYSGSGSPGGLTVGTSPGSFIAPTGTTHVGDPAETRGRNVALMYCIAYN